MTTNPFQFINAVAKATSLDSKKVKEVAHELFRAMHKAAYCNDGGAPCLLEAVEQEIGVPATAAMVAFLTEAENHLWPDLDISSWKDLAEDRNKENRSFKTFFNQEILLRDSWVLEKEQCKEFFVTLIPHMETIYSLRHIVDVASKRSSDLDDATLYTRLLQMLDALPKITPSTGLTLSIHHGSRFFDIIIDPAYISVSESGVEYSEFGHDATSGASFTIETFERAKVHGDVDGMLCDLEQIVRTDDALLNISEN